MNNQQKLRLFAMPVAVASLALTPFLACNELQNTTSTLCCSEFVPGTDLSAVDWGLEGQAQVSYGALMQAIGDFSATATAMASDVANACQSIATDLGEDPNAVKETRADLKAKAWCDRAIAKITEKAGQAKLTLDYQPPSCNVQASVQANCEAKCSGKIECEVTPAEIIARCEPGQLSGKCEAECTGSCEGSANLAVTCEGTCNGTCEGDCDAACSSQLGNKCNGRCEGKCSGKCRGSCEVAADAKLKCEGQCTGGCTVEVKAPKCQGELKPPKAECNADVDCNASCKASASAKIECVEPSLTLDGAAGVEDVIATLKVNLPKLLVVAEGKGDLMAKNAQDIVGASGSLSFDSTKAIACLVPASTAISTALQNIEASFTGAVNITLKVKGG